jgi:dynein heavy chain 1
VAQGRSNIAPVKMPWDLIRTLLTETYGGKIDDEGDFQQLSELVRNVFTAAAFEIDYKLVQEDAGGGEGLTVPSGTGVHDFMEWINKLPEREPPTFLGLPANAEKLLLVGHGRNAIANAARITEMLDEGEQFMAEGDSASA